ncbi:MAG: hypothetical protein WD097_07110 [Balneolales bacterium]
MFCTQKKILPGMVLTGMALLLLFACELPSRPDFQFQHHIQVPIIANRNVEFIGGANALIDTTSLDFEDMFSIDGDGLVRIVTSVDFNIGDFHEIFPKVDVNPADIEADIGFIKVSFTGRGSSSYEDITGVSGNDAPVPGQPVGAGVSPEIDVELDIVNFEGGIIESGGLQVSFTNDLGFDVSEIEASILSEGVIVTGPEHVTDIGAGESKNLIFMFQQNDVLTTPINIRIRVSWDAQTVSGSPEELHISTVDNELLARSVTAVIRQQDFYSDGEIDVDDGEFRFEKNTHYAYVRQGNIIIEQVINSIDLDIDTLKISFPGILIPPLWVPLVIEFSGNDRIKRLEVSSTPRITDLSGSKIHAVDNVIHYDLMGITEDARFHPQADSFRTIVSTDQIATTVALNDLMFGEVFGVVRPRTIFLSEDDGNDGNLDLSNPSEAQITELNDLEFLSKRLSNLTFYSPRLNLVYKTNIGVPARVYAAIAGINPDHNMEVMYLRPEGSVSDFQWTSADTLEGFLNNGVEIPSSHLIAFDIQPNPNSNSEPVSQVISFNESNSNIEEFISYLPVEVRFIGKTISNQESEDGIVIDPVIFETSLDLDVPLNFATDSPAAYKDTIESVLDFLPDEYSDTRVTHAAVNIIYENRLPLELLFELNFLDKMGQVVTYLPINEEQADQLRLKAAPIDGQTRFSNGAASGEFSMILNEDQLRTLYRTKNIQVSGDLMTAIQEASSEIKIRSDDYFKFSLNMDVIVNTRVD